MAGMSLTSLFGVKIFVLFLQQSTDMALTLSERKELALIVQELERRDKGRFAETFFRDTGECRRELYPKHMEFFRRGNDTLERLFLAANRVGKCATYNTKIDTVRGRVSIGELYDL